MERPLVLAMSPRAGRRNEHRYFAPSDSTLSEKEVARLIDAALDSRSADESVVHAEHMVEQVATGRVNPEILLVRDARLARCPADARAKVKSILRDSLTEFGRFVADLSEADEGTGLLVRHKRFDELSEDVLRKSAAFMSAVEEPSRNRERTNPAPVPPPPEGPPRDREPKPRPRRIDKRLLAAACVLAVAAFFYSRLPGSRPQEDRGPSPSQPSPQGNENAASSSPTRIQQVIDSLKDVVSRSSPKPVEPNLEDLYIAVVWKGPPEDEAKARADYKIKVYDDARSEIVGELKRGLGTHDTYAEIAPENVLRTLLGEYYVKLHRGNKTELSPEDLVIDQGFANDLNDLFKVDWKARNALASFRCDADRDRFHDVFNAFVALQGAVAKARDKSVFAGLPMDWRREFVAHLPPKGYLTPPVKRSDSPPGLYVEEDEGIGVEIRNLLEALKENVEKAIRDIDRDRKTLDKDASKAKEDEEKSRNEFREYMNENAGSVTEEKFNLLQDPIKKAKLRHGEITKRLTALDESKLGLNDFLGVLGKSDPEEGLYEKLRDSRGDWESGPLKEALDATKDVDEKVRSAFQKLKALSDAWLSKEGTGPTSPAPGDSP